jgi:hypothetical protein
MREKTDIELAKGRLLKAIRTAVRLKYSLAADSELNAALPAAEEAFDKAVLQGNLPETAALEVFSAVLDD